MPIPRVSRSSDGSAIWYYDAEGRLLPYPRVQAVHTLLKTQERTSTVRFPKLKMWWRSRQRGEVRQAILMITLVLSLVILRSSELYDINTELDGIRRELAAHKRQVPYEGVPAVVFVLDAKSPQELDEKMAAIAGTLDTHRYSIFKEKKK